MNPEFKTTFHVDFIADKCHQGYARYEIDLPFPPNPNIEFEQSVWHEPRTPVSITYSIDDPSFYVVFQEDKLDSKEDLKQHKDMYESHGWTVS